MTQEEKELRAKLEASYGQVFNTEELTENFRVNGFLAPFVDVERKSDGKRGTLRFDHMPRFYYNFIEA